MFNLKKTKQAILVIILFMTAVCPVQAQEETAGDYMYGMSSKFGRGLLNVLTSPAEIPCTMRDDMKDMAPAAGFFTGFGKGTVFMLRRILVGVTEIGTFIIPMERTIPPVCQETL